MAKNRAIEDAERVAEELRKPEYRHLQVRVLEDGTIAATVDLMYTRAVVIDCDHIGYSRRYCFKDRSRADQELLKLTNGDDTPTGFTASRDPRTYSK